MKTSLNWLNAHLPQPVSQSQAEDLLTRQGFPVEGADAVDADVCLDVEVTSNRGDCLSHVGMAREIAAGTRQQVNLPDTSLPEPKIAGENVDRLTRVDNHAGDDCPVYTARVIRGVKVGPSPDWLVQRLEAIGQRPVNNVVDVTNYVLFEMGQPLHAFDLNKLAGRRIVVRHATKNEPFTAIDSTRHKLREHMLVIADAEEPVAVAGVMGGLDSEVTADTKDVLLESAAFAPLSVRRTSRTLKLASESSYRFERGVDPRGIDSASRRAAQLIVDLAGGTIAPGVIRAGADEPEPNHVAMRIDRCNALLGTALSGDDICELLAPLGLQPRVEADAVACTIPSHRLDLEREVDLIEEVARIYGLDRIGVKQKIEIIARRPQDEVIARRLMGEVLVGHGYHETVTFSFIAPARGRAFVPADHAPLDIEDERRKAEPMLRPAVTPSLLQCRKANQDVGNDQVKLFEVASVWSKVDGRIIESRSLGMMRDADDAQQAVREIKGAIAEVVERLGGGAKLSFEAIDHANCAAAAAAAVVVDHRRIGHIGALDQATQKLFELQTGVVVAELDAHALIALYPAQRKVAELSRFPAIERDLSAVVDEAVTWESIEREVRDTQPQLLEDIAFITTYRGKPIAKGSKSVSFRMLFRDPQKTLRHEQVDPQVNRIIDRLKDKLGAELRA